MTYFDALITWSKTALEKFPQFIIRLWSVRLILHSLKFSEGLGLSVDHVLSHRQPLHSVHRHLIHIGHLTYQKCCVERDAT